ncbi:MAG: OmpA family protein [Gemmatimonadales bacterium]
MRPTRRFAPHRNPTGRLAWLLALSACAGAEKGPQSSGDPGIRAAAAAPAALGNTSTTDCEDGATAGPDTGDVLSRNEIRSWARPDQPSSRTCRSGSSPAVAATVQPVEALAADSPAPAQPEARAAATDPMATGPAGVSVPLVSGLILLSVHRFPDGDRENVVIVSDVSPDGVTYTWQFIQQEKSGDPFEESFERFVRATDFASAPRLNNLFTRRGRSDAPGYTAFSISRATYARVRVEGQAPYTFVSAQGGPFGGALSGVFMTRVTLKGTLTLASAAPEPMPVLLNGRRVSVPVLRLKGRFAFQDRKEEHDYWVLADSVHPVLLRTVVGADTLQTVSIQVPEASAEKDVERRLETACRAELPGVYFAFARAELQSASAPTLAGVAALLKRHPDWSFGIEGHTDSIGDPASNQALSQRRAEAVRAKLVEHYRIGPDRLQAVGFGATRPREPNATIEGRARNRRVELVRACAGARG